MSRPMSHIKLLAELAQMRKNPRGTAWIPPYAIQRQDLHELSDCEAVRLCTITTEMELWAFSREYMEYLSQESSDVSAIPVMNTANIQATAYAFSERAADLLDENWDKFSAGEEPGWAVA